MTHAVAIAVLCIVVAGVAAQWAAWRLRLPAIVLLFAVGLAVGPGLQILRPSVTFGPALQPIVGLAVAIVVFEGGLALDVRELRAAGQGVARLTLAALPIGFVLAAIAAHAAGGMAWEVAALYAAIVVVTGPTVVLPLVRNTRLERRAASFLKWEAIVNDPVGALLASIVLALIIAHGGAGGSLAVALVLGLLASLGLGVGSAFLLRWLFARDLAPEVLKVPMVLAAAMGVYVVANLLLDGAGLAAATILGIALANMHIRGLEELARFKEALVVLIVSALFVVLSASLERSVFAALDWSSFWLTLTMIFVVRPLAIVLATWRSDLTWQERALAAWIAPRGVVAAAVAGLASNKLAGAGIHGAEAVMPAVFALIAATVVLHGFSLAPLARRLKLTLADRPGLAILGATDWSMDLALALQQGGTPVLVVDTYPGALRAERRPEVAVLQAEILSEHGEEGLAGRRVDYLLAATRNEVYNALACTKLAPTLGRARVFQMAPIGGEIDAWVGLSKHWRGQVVGAPPVDFATARRRFAEGWRFHLVEVEASAADDAARDAPEAEPARSDAVEPAPDDEILWLVLRRNGDLVFASPETTPPTPVPGDRRLVLSAVAPTSVQDAPAEAEAGEAPSI